MQNALFRYWGKADPSHPGEPKWHPLVYHCLDVAAVGVEYLARAPALRRLLVDILGGKPASTVEWRSGTPCMILASSPRRFRASPGSRPGDE